MKINLWKEDFDKNVIKRVLADHEPTTSVPTSAILGRIISSRDVIEVEDSQNSSQESQDALSQSSSNKLDHATDRDSEETSSQEN